MISGKPGNAERRKAYLRAMGFTLLRLRSNAEDKSAVPSVRPKQPGRDSVVQASADRSLKQNLNRQQKTATERPKSSPSQTLQKPRPLQTPDRVIIAETAEALIIDLPLPSWRKVEPKNYRLLLANLLRAAGLTAAEPSVSLKLWPAPKVPDEPPEHFFHGLLHEKLRDSKERRALLVLSSELIHYMTGFKAPHEIKVFTTASAAQTLQEPLNKKLLWEGLKAHLKPETTPKI